MIGKKKNFVINGILEAYLKAYPQKRPAPKEPDEEYNKAKKAKHDVCKIGTIDWFLKDLFD